MAINPALLIAAPILQDYFVDKTTGAPLSGGIITFYQDNSRTTLKNVYYQTGTPGAYTYLPLPNPLTLSDVGTIEDANGNDVIPYFYPYSELDNTTPQPYYVTVYSSSGQLQFTRANFPFNPNTGTGVVSATNNNLIANNEFWRNIGSLNATTLTNSFTLNGLTLYDAIIAPSQHDGFTDMSDIQFIKDANGATDTITFEKFVGNFPNQIIPDSVTPEFYLNVDCSGTGSETVKYIQVPIQLHVDSLSGVTNCSATIAAMAESGNPSITIKLFQFLGTGVTSPSAATLETIILSNTWQKYIVTFTFPSAQGLTLGNGGDDAFYLQIGFPAASVFNINIALPSVYLAIDPPTNDWQTYDEINAIISSPRTGDVRTSMNSFYPFGWVPMNNGTIGDAASNATARANIDTWPLFELLWNAFNLYTNGSTNPLAQMVTSGGSNVAYGGSAIFDFTSNNAITLTKSMGEVFLGTVPVSALLASYGTTFTAINSTGLALITSVGLNVFNGMPFYVSNTGGALPTGLVANTIYYVANFSGTNAFNAATSFANSMAGIVISYTDAGSGTNSFKSALAGTYEGEYAHAQLLAELATHNHAFGTHQSNATAGGLSDTFLSAQSIVNVYANPGFPIFNTGSSTPFNVTQPGTFYNIYMKL
jgi:hypothetical protein